MLTLQLVNSCFATSMTYWLTPSLAILTHGPKTTHSYSYGTGSNSRHLVANVNTRQFSINLFNTWPSTAQVTGPTVWYSLPPNISEVCHFSTHLKKSKSHDNHFLSSVVYLKLISLRQCQLGHNYSWTLNQSHLLTIMLRTSFSNRGTVLVHRWPLAPCSVEPRSL